MLLNNGKNDILSLRIIFIILSVLFSSFEMNAQKKSRDEPPPLSDRIFFGGSFGLQFGSITDIQVSPVAGIWVLPRVAVAAGPTYRFYKDYFIKTDLYGGRGYVQLAVIQNLNNIIPIGSNTGIFLHLEDELLSLASSAWKTPPYSSNRFYLNTVLAGGGLSQQIGRRASINLMALWPLNQSIYNIYSNPEFRVSFTF
jgi:hypothetical protein